MQTALKKDKPMHAILASVPDHRRFRSPDFQLRTIFGVEF